MKQLVRVGCVLESAAIPELSPARLCGSQLNLMFGGGSDDQAMF
jgi:hypothetical protein